VKPEPLRVLKAGGESEQKQRLEIHLITSLLLIAWRRGARLNAGAPEFKIQTNPSTN